MLMAHKFISGLDQQRDIPIGLDALEISWTHSSKFIDDVINTINNSQKFYGGEFGKTPRTKYYPELVRLPFHRVYIEFDASFSFSDGALNYRICSICMQNEQKENTIGCVLFVLMQGVPVPIGSVEIERDSEKGLRFSYYILPNCVFKNKDRKKLYQQDGFLFAQELSFFLQALNCNNVSIQENDPSAALNKKRKKKGKLPLYSYKTLYLDIPSQSGEHQRSGEPSDRNRPRLHLRRGHIRQYKPGQYTWVQPCMVGNPTGFVDKEYSARG